MHACLLGAVELIHFEKIGEFGICVAQELRSKLVYVRRIMDILSALIVLEAVCAV